MVVEEADCAGVKSGESSVEPVHSSCLKVRPEGEKLGCPVSISLLSHGTGPPSSFKSKTQSDRVDYAFIIALRRLGLKDCHNFLASLVYTVNPRLV